MRIAVLLCLPAWCHGEHGLPRPSLVQVSHAKAEAASVSSTLAGFQKFTDALVDQYKKREAESPTAVPVTGMAAHDTDKSQMDTDTRNAIEQVMGFIYSFFPTAAAQHAVQQSAVQACSDGVCLQTCSIDETTVNSLKNNQEQKLTSVTNCVDQCVQDGVQNNAKCAAWDEYRLNDDHALPPCVYNEPGDDFCMQENDEGHGTFDKGDLCDNKIKADEDDEADELETMEDCLEDVHDWLSALKPVSDACERGGEQSTCDDEVREYHSEHCEYVEVLQLQCNNFDSCVTGCNGNCDAQFCDQVDIESGARMADNETGERIVCLLSVLLNETVINKTSELESCKDSEAAIRYADLAGYFALPCEPSTVEPSYPGDVPCDDRYQDVSMTDDYMRNFMNIGRLLTTDSNNPEVSDQDSCWNSCASAHVCSVAGGVAYSMCPIVFH